MSTINDGGPAFPVWELNGQGKAEMTCFGMTLRDYFAAKALNGYLASYAPDDNPFKNGPAVARDCYELADAMLAAREADTQS